MKGLQGLSGNEEVPTSLPSTSGSQKEGEAHLQALIIKRGHAAAEPTLVSRKFIGPAFGWTASRQLQIPMSPSLSHLPSQHFYSRAAPEQGEQMGVGLMKVYDTPKGA